MSDNNEILEETENIRHSRPLEELEAILGYQFKDRSLLQLAMTHESYSHEFVHCVGNNERLEFLGDSIVGFAACQYMYRHLPQEMEGTMAKIKSSVVSTRSLGQRAMLLDLGHFLRMGRGEDNESGRSHIKILADAFEALVGALYLDGGLELANDFVIKYLAPAIESREGVDKDYKSRLQELTLKQFGKRLPVYESVREDGPPHAPVFSMRVLLGNEEIGCGTGHSKAEASQQAAREGLQFLQSRLECRRQEEAEAEKSGPNDVSVAATEPVQAEQAESSDPLMPTAPFKPSFMV